MELRKCSLLDHPRNAKSWMCIGSSSWTCHGTSCSSQCKRPLLGSLTGQWSLTHYQPSHLWVFPTNLLFWDFPGGTVGRNPPANAGDSRLISDLGRSHMSRSNSAHKPHLQSPSTATTETCASRAYAPQQGKPTQWEAQAPWWTGALTHHNWREAAQGSKDPAQPKKRKKKNSPNFLPCHVTWVCVCPLSLCGHIQIINAYILLLSNFTIEISSADVFIHI